MDVGGVLLCVGVTTALVYFVGNYRGRYGQSRIGLRGSVIVAIVLLCLILSWQAIT